MLTDTNYTEKVKGKRLGGHKNVPKITLQGLWLERNGFYKGAEFRTRTEKNKIILTKVSE